MRIMTILSLLVSRYVTENIRKHKLCIMHEYGFNQNLQSITKKHVPYVFPVYLRNRLSYKKSIYIFLYQFLKSSQLEQKFFKSDDTIS